MWVYQCEDSLEGIFTAIYKIYEDKCDRQDVIISLTGELFFFAEYITVETDGTRAMKVINTLRRRFGEDNYMELCMALSSPDPDKAQAVYRTVEAGLSSVEAFPTESGASCSQGHLLDNLANPFVHKVFSLARGANNEYLHLRGFLRFAELENGILYSAFHPKNNVLTFLMPHFADRFPMENFVLWDQGRGLYGVHPADRQWYLVRDSALGTEQGQGASADTQSDSSGARQDDARPQSLSSDSRLVYSAEELHYQELFRHFCTELSIQERRNLELQRNMLPLRFRQYMVEFD